MDGTIVISFYNSYYMIIIISSYYHNRMSIVFYTDTITYVYLRQIIICSWNMTYWIFIIGGILHHINH